MSLTSRGCSAPVKSLMGTLVACSYCLKFTAVDCAAADGRRSFSLLALIDFTMGCVDYACLYCVSSPSGLELHLGFIALLSGYYGFRT